MEDKNRCGRGRACGRPAKKPGYDPAEYMAELMDTVAEVYHSTNSLKATALELNLPPNKVKKLLITAKVLSYLETEQIQRLLNAGKSVAEVGEELHLSRATINTYLPYSKCVYKAVEISQNAERVAKYRERKKTVEDIQESMSEESLWQTVIAFQGYKFHTSSGLPFSYTLKIGRDGNFTRELFVNRRENSKSLAWSSVRLAFQSALEKRGTVITGPKELANVRGVSYIYSLFWRFKIITVPKGIEGCGKMERNRKPGGGRKPSKPDYDPGAILKEQIDEAVALYGTSDHPSLQTIADELDLNPIKVRKLLIAAGVYESAVAGKVLEAFDRHRRSGLSHKDAIAATMKELDLSKSSVTSYLPYEKGVYFPAETNRANLSVGAERVRRMRERKKDVQSLHDAMEERELAGALEENLWACVVAFQGYRFHTSSGLPFTYTVKRGRDGSYTGELIVSRKEGSKTLTRSSVMLAFHRVMERRGECGAGDAGDAPEYSGPKAIGQIFGISYIYSLFWRFGLIRVPGKVEEKLRK